MTRVKICGITSLGDARASVELGAWAIGLIFWPGSPRACAIEDAELIGAELHRRAEVAGVFVNATLDEVAATADRCGLTMLQLHGDEGPAYCREAARRTGCRIIKAARVRDAAQVQALRPFRTDFHLLDAHSSVAPGRHRRELRLDARAPPRRHAADRALRAGSTRTTWPRRSPPPRPFAVDTASGTEAEPGRKDPAKLAAFFRAVAGADSAAGAAA